MTRIVLLSSPETADLTLLAAKQSVQWGKYVVHALNFDSNEKKQQTARGCLQATAGSSVLTCPG